MNKIIALFLVCALLTGCTDQSASDREKTAAWCEQHNYELNPFDYDYCTAKNCSYYNAAGIGRNCTYTNIKIPVMETMQENTIKNTDDTTSIPEITTRTFNNATRIIDGDTIEIDTGEHVRLLCINTPERGEPYAKEATQLLRDLIENKTVTLEKDKSDKDRYGRLLRYVYINQDFINEQMVSSGLAKYAPYKPDTKNCPNILLAQEYAQQQKKGMWTQ